MLKRPLYVDIVRMAHVDLYVAKSFHLSHALAYNRYGPYTRYCRYSYRSCTVVVLRHCFLQPLLTQFMTQRYTTTGTELLVLTTLQASLKLEILDCASTYNTHASHLNKSVLLRDL